MRYQIDEETLRAMQVLCGFCAKALYASLETADLAALREQSELLSQEPFATVAPQAAQAIRLQLEGASSAEELDRLYHELRQDYAYLFYQVPLSKASPYESVYRTDDATLFGPTTLQVREAYLQEGFEMVDINSQPDDHLGTELEFLARLFSEAAEAVEQGNTALGQAKLESACRFASDHVLVFASMYLQKLRQAASTEWYRAVADIAEATIDALAQLLGAQATDTVYER